jgi:predicted molibdopterin-dependent oxidoreductase YjgC
VAKLTLNGVEIEVDAGAPLVEVIKQQGVWISNLCYIDGLAPYAGCRTCLVEVEGAKGLQLSCTARVADGMVVNTETPQVKHERQQVLAIINADHSDRCLTCHRRVKCMPGDICLRDDVVTHRCVTCSKNYRCELQSTNELLDMGFDNVEPWVLEDRTYYQTEQPDPDRANPFFEFDPQMCILCTRCVRACDEIRHTTAIGLSNKGYTARIAFGAGGAIHESNCDFCGACIDVCPTATLMEKPNKWTARTEDWTSTTCNSCSVGCTISVGTRSGRAVIVKPDYVNPVSADQICVRGRFHYDAIADKQRLSQHYVRRGPARQGGSSTVTPQFPAHWGELMSHAAAQLQGIIEKHGVKSVAVLGSPFNTNEENYLAQKLARDVIGTPHIDFSSAGPNRAAGRAIEAAFGTEALAADAMNIARSDLIVVIAGDLEESHNVFSLRVKDAIVGHPAAPKHGKLVLISAQRGELADFAEPYGGIWLQPRVGEEAAVVDALSQDDGNLPALVNGDAPGARQLLGPAKAISIIYAPNPVDAKAAGAGAKAAANLAIALCGEKAAESLFILPTEANANGARDMGVDPARGPGRGVAAEAGMDFAAMIEAAIAGTLKAMIVVGDNPLMFAPGTATVREALEKLELLIVIDSTMTDTAKLAHCLFADVPLYAKTGTVSNAERRVNRLHAALDALGDARPALLALTDLANTLKADSFAYTHPDAVTDEIAAMVPGYETFSSKFERWGKVRVAEAATKSEPQPVVAQPVEDSPRRAVPAVGDGALLLTTGRTLFTSLEGASVHAAAADKLHREEFVELHPADAAALRIADGAEVLLVTDNGELALRAKLSDRVQEGVAFVPYYYDGGAVCALLARDGAPVSVRVKVAATA